jgi:hypothetical protein
VQTDVTDAGQVADLVAATLDATDASTGAVALWDRRTC